MPRQPGQPRAPAGRGAGRAAHPALLVPPVGEREDEPDAVARGLGQQQVVALQRELVVHARRHLDRLVVLGRLVALARARARAERRAPPVLPGAAPACPSAPARARVAIAASSGGAGRRDWSLTYHAPGLAHALLAGQGTCTLHGGPHVRAMARAGRGPKAVIRGVSHFVRLFCKIVKTPQRHYGYAIDDIPGADHVQTAKHASQTPPTALTSCCRHTASVARTVPLPLKKPKTRMTCTPRRACSARLKTTCARAARGGVAGGRVAQRCTCAAGALLCRRARRLPARPSPGSAAEAHCTCRCLGGVFIGANGMHADTGVFSLPCVATTFSGRSLEARLRVVPPVHVEQAVLVGPAEVPAGSRSPACMGHCVKQVHCAGRHHRRHALHTQHSGEVPNLVEPKSSFTAHRHGHERRLVINNHMGEENMQLLPKRCQQTSAVAQGRQMNVHAIIGRLPHQGRPSSSKRVPFVFTNSEGAWSACAA
jgi:hypothetical protein